MVIKSFIFGTIESCIIEVPGTRSFISNYQYFKLYGDRRKNIEPHKIIIIIFFIKHKFSARKRNV